MAWTAILSSNRQEDGHIFLGQGKYVVDILTRFQMEDCKSMTTPMTTNWKKLVISEGELVDPQYRQLIGSLMYLVNTRSELCSQHLESIYAGAQERALSDCKACAQVP